MPEFINPDIRVSVVIPTRNRVKMLRRAIDSVLAQSLTRFELVVVDDASTDDTIKMLQSLQEPRLKVQRMPTPLGAPKARNEGLRLCRGEFVAFLDDDDEWLPTKLEQQVQRLDQTSADVGCVHSGTALISDASGQEVHRFRPEDRHFNVDELLGSIEFTTSNMMVRRHVLDEIGGFDETLAGGQDRDLWIRIAERYRMAGVPDPLVRRHFHGDQISSSLAAKIRAKEQLLAKYAGHLAKLPEKRAYHLWRLGILRALDGQIGLARKDLLRSICIRPLAREPWHDLMTTILEPASSSQVLDKRRIDRIDGIPNYY